MSQTSRLRRWVLPLLLLALLVTACGGAETGPGESDPTTTPMTGAGAPGPDEAAETAATEYLAAAGS